LWVWGENQGGKLGLNQQSDTYYSSPVQVPGTNWTGPLYAGGSMAKAIRRSPD